MRSKVELLRALTHPGVIAVVRAQKTEQVLPLTEALLAGGVVAIEITMTTPNALDAIRLACQQFGQNAIFGVGTVLNAQVAEQALEAGAEFIVSPVMRPEIARAAASAERPVMLGAFSPTEALAAHEAGSDFVKIFPADCLGPAFIKAILAPLPQLRIIPTGIAKPEDVTAFIKAGCAAVGLGSLLIPAQALRDSAWSELTRLAQIYVGLVHSARQK